LQHGTTLSWSFSSRDRDAGKQWNDEGIASLPFQKGGNEGGGAFSQQSHRQFHGLSSRLKKFIAAIRAPKKFRMIFYNFCYLFEVNMVAAQKQA